MTPLRIIFMGSPDFAVAPLRALHAAGHTIVAVYCQPPRPAGRGKRDRPTPVHLAAEELGIPVNFPTSLRGAEEQAHFASFDADVAVVAAYGLILPQAILDVPRFGCVNIHASLLPRWRGAAPIHRAIMAGDEETGICIMQMEAGLDTGPVLAERRITIAPDDTTATLHDKLADLGAEMISPAVEDLAAGKVTPKPQPADGITYASKIDKAEGLIDWSEPAAAIDRKVRGLAPFPGAHTAINGQRVKVLAGAVTDQKGEAGLTIDSALLVGCGEQSYRLTRVQPSGRGAMAAADYLRGRPVPAGTRLAGEG